MSEAILNTLTQPQISNGMAAGNKGRSLPAQEAAADTPTFLALLMLMGGGNEGLPGQPDLMAALEPTPGEDAVKPDLSQDQVMDWGALIAWLEQLIHVPGQQSEPKQNGQTVASLQLAEQPAMPVDVDQVKTLLTNLRELMKAQVLTAGTSIEQTLSELPPSQARTLASLLSIYRGGTNRPPVVETFSVFSGTSGEPAAHQTLVQTNPQGQAISALQSLRLMDYSLQQPTHQQPLPDTLWQSPFIKANQAGAGQVLAEAPAVKGSELPVRVVPDLFKPQMLDLSAKPTDTSGPVSAPSGISGFSLLSQPLDSTGVSQPLPGAQLAETIQQWLISSSATATALGKNQLTIKLYPENLGHLKIDISTVNGQINARFHVDSGAVKQLLDQHLDSFRQALNLQGLHVNKVEIVQQPVSQSLSSASYYSGQGPNFGGHSGNSQQHYPQQGSSTVTGSRDTVSADQENEEGSTLAPEGGRHDRLHRTKVNAVV